MRKTISYVMLLTCVLSLTACGGRGTSRQAAENDSVLYKQAVDSISDVASTQDKEKAFALIDSFRNAGRLTAAEADHQRGVTHFMCGETSDAIAYWQKVIEACRNGSEHNMVLYAKALINVASNWALNYQFEEALHLLMPLANEMLESPQIEPYLKAQIFDTIGQCQVGLKHFDEAKNSYAKAYGCYQQTLTEHPTAEWVKKVSYSLSNIFIFYDVMKQPAEKLFWTDRVDSLLNVLKDMPDGDMEYHDWMYGQTCLSRAKVLMVTGKPAEAAKVYDQYLKTSYAQTENGRYNSLDYLDMNGRYAEAADIYDEFDNWAKEAGRDVNMAVIVGDLFPMFHFNYYAGRTAKATQVMVRIDSLIRPAYKQQQESDAARLATIFETQQKEAQIARQQAELSQQRLWSAAIVFTLITLFFIIYTIHRRRAARRLAEMKAAQERIESELRIARDIQMSMVPSVFPDREGLDIYASMTPAKEVGGDLYGYVLLGDKLYFAVGDVSGKGVPASLFMAQATRLFRTMATQGLMPAEICTRMNDALSGDDNQNGMFVTFFLGLLDLASGHLDFCNAGHNPPVVIEKQGGEATAHSSLLEMEPNAPIGLWPGLEYVGEEIDSIKGRPLFIYTDGLNEAEDPQQQQFGDDRLLDILSTTPYSSAQQVVETLAAEVERHRNGAMPNDDLTMMCIIEN